jgi:alanine dehydrogenase
MIPVFVSAAATREVLDWDDAIAGLRAAYSAPHTQATSVRALARGQGSWLRGLVAVPPNRTLMGSKVFGLARERRATYLISLFDQDTGDLVALVDGIDITSMRTAATSALALDALAPRRPIVLGVCGSGAEAKAHVRAFSRVRTLQSVSLYSPTVANRERAADELASELGIACTAHASARDAIEGSDVVLAAARSHDETPVFEGAWLRPGMVVVSVGSTLSEQREIDHQTIAACDLIVCDMVHEVVELTGDFIAARDAGVPFSEKMASLNDLVMGRLTERVGAARLTMYKSVGAALQDITVASIAVERARQRGLSIALPIELETKHV